MENKEIKVVYYKNIECDKKMHYWHGGEVASIQYNDELEFVITATGDMIGEIYDKNGNSVDEFKDKNDDGEFYNTAIKYFKNDKELDSAIFFYTPSKEEVLELGLEYYVVFDNSNWWEVFAVVDDKMYDLDGCLDGMYLDEALSEVLKDIDTFAKETLEYIR